MARSCSGQAARIFIIAVNALTLVAGLAFFILGLVLRFTSADTKQKVLKALGASSVQSLAAVTIVLIAIGVVLIVLSFCGLCGALRENQCMLVTFAGLMVALIIAELVIGIMAFVMAESGTLKTKVIEAGLNDTASKLNEQNCELWQDMQHDLKCCGLYGTELPHKEICSNLTKKIDCPPEGTNQQPGCVDALYKFLESSAMAIGITTAVFMALEIFSLLFAVWLFRDVRRRVNDIRGVITYGDRSSRY